jgi:hypothetical protein
LPIAHYNPARAKKNIPFQAASPAGGVSACEFFAKYWPKMTKSAVCSRKTSQLSQFPLVFLIIGVKRGLLY